MFLVREISGDAIKISKKYKTADDVKIDIYKFFQTTDNALSFFESNTKENIDKAVLGYILSCSLIYVKASFLITLKSNFGKKGALFPSLSLTKTRCEKTAYNPGKDMHFDVGDITPITYNGLIYHLCEMARTDGYLRKYTADQIKQLTIDAYYKNEIDYDKLKTREKAFDQFLNYFSPDCEDEIIKRDRHELVMKKKNHFMDEIKKLSKDDAFYEESFSENAISDVDALNGDEWGV